MKKLVLAAVVALTASVATADMAMSPRGTQVLEVFDRMLDSGAVKSIDDLYDRFYRTPMFSWLAEEIDTDYFPEFVGTLDRDTFHDLVEGDLVRR